MEHFTTSDGASIAYEVTGEGRPLLFLHGLMANRAFFGPQQPLANDFRLISVDFRGHGESRRAGERPNVDQLASDISTLAEHLDLSGAIGIGWSLGASVLWQVLSGPASARFAAAVIVDMTPRVLNKGDWQLGLSAEICDARTAAIRDDYSTFALAAGQAIFAQPVEDGKREAAAWAGEQFGKNDSAAMSSVWASLLDKDYRPLLSGIMQPTLIIRGGKSQLYGTETADYLAGALPQARTVTLERSGHAPHVEQPELFNQIIRDFAASLPRVRENQTTA